MHDMSALHSVDRQNRYMSSADRLIRSAVEGVSSFYSETPGKFRGFIRDTLPDTDAARYSTGGVAVTADLWYLEPHMPYFRAVLGEEAFAELSRQRNEATEWLGDSTKTLELSSTFGNLNPLTTSSIAYQLAQQDELRPRAAVFCALILSYYRDPEGWPRLPNVEHAHPYVAAGVFRAAEYLLRRGVDSILRQSTVDADIERANICDIGDLSERIRPLYDGSPIDFEQTRRNYQEASLQYLWRQHGLAAGTASNAVSPEYDPVGTCFALSILVDATLADVSDGDSAHRLAEYSNLIQASVRHVVAALTPTGSLAYGLPFTYSPKGMGAFATSISGLATLTRTLNQIFRRSRRDFYRNSSWLEEFVTSDAALLDGLFSLSTTLEGSRRRVRRFTGWSNDRAPSFSRIESWVTVDVLSFAMDIRLLSQEIAQLQVIRRYGGSEVTGEPDWPYAAGTPSDVPLPNGLQDPDEIVASDPAAAVSRRLAPIQVLHGELHQLMLPNSTRWKVEKSSFLLFGPPGTAKSTLAKSLAKRLQWHFIELTPSNFVDHGLEMVERRAKEIFEDLGTLRETVILFDELDSLLTDRELLDASSILNFSVPAMLPKLQKLRKIATKQRLLLIFATNFYDRLDPAMVRRGRVDERLLVLPFNLTARTRFFQRILPTTKMAAEKTPLAVFEDLQRFAQQVISGAEPTTVPAITPTLYFSRVPRKERAATSLRSTERLALEIAEVVGRLLDLPRELGADSSPSEIAARLDRLASELPSTSVPERDAWKQLCHMVRNALSTTST